MTQGLYEKFRVRKLQRDDNGRLAYFDVKDFVFVLRPERDPAAAEALRTYITCIAHTNPRLAWDLVHKLGTEYQTAVFAAGGPMPDQVHP